MKSTPYKICVQCIMDTSDPQIYFDEQGVCNHCLKFKENAKKYWFPNQIGQKKLEALISQIKLSGKNHSYDVIIGLSGGVDSSYLCYWAVKEVGLRVLAVHVDAGWNSELAVSNIEKIVKLLEIDLVTQVVDWEEMRDLQLAFFKAGVANQDIPQDHAFLAGVYAAALKNNIRYILNGSNLATESILPIAWGHSSTDLDHIKGIHKKFGTKPLVRFPKVTFFQHYVSIPYIKKIRVIKPLNYMDYNKTQAIEVLEKKLGWRYYGGKHYESRFTKFFQSYWLPEKFGYDKRRAHLSSLIVSQQLSREAALSELTKPTYNLNELQEDKILIAKKLGISIEEFNNLMQQPNKHYTDYPNDQWKVDCLNKLLLGRQKIKKILTKKQYHFLFYCSCYVDEIWIRSTIHSLKDSAVSIGLLIAGKIPDNIYSLYSQKNVEIHSLNRWRRPSFFKAPVLISASSGVQKKHFSSSIKYFIHMPHSLASLHAIYPLDAFDGFDCLFSAGAHHVNEFKEMDGIRGKNREIYPVGYGKLDVLLSEMQTKPAVEARHVVIAPSWGDSNIIDSIGIALVEQLLKANFKVTLRPHPMFFFGLKESLLPFRKIIDPLFYIEHPSQDMSSLYTASILITDYSGIAFEFLLLKKRAVIFVDVPRKILNTEFARYTAPPIEIEGREKYGTVVAADSNLVFEAVCEAHLSRTAPAVETSEIVFNYGACGKAASKILLEMLE